MHRNWIKAICTNVLSCVIGYLLLNAGINGIISPFFTSFIFALFFQVQNLKLFIFGVCLSVVLYGLNLSSIIFIVNFLLVMLLTKLLIWKRGVKLNVIAIFPIMLIGSICELLVVFKSAEMLVLGIINKLLELVVVYSYIVLFKGVSVRGVNTRLALDEMFGLSLLIAPIVLSSTKIVVFHWNLAMFLVPLIILMVVYLLGSKEAFIFAIIAGIGASFNNLKLDLVAIWTLITAGVVLVERLGRIPMALMAVIMQLMCGFYFKVYITFSFTDLIPILSAGTVFASIPKKLLMRAKIGVENRVKDLALSEIVVQEERFLTEQLRRVSNVFLDMHKIYKGMVLGGVDREQMEEAIKRDITSNNCTSCIKYKNCYEGRALTSRSLDELIKKGLSKGKVSLIDTPTLLASCCPKTNQIIFNLNTRLEEYKLFDEGVKSEDESKITMSNQLLGVSEILTNFEHTFAFGERANKKEEEALINSLLYCDIIAREACIYRKNAELSRVIVVIKNAGYKREKILNAIKGFFKRKFEILEARYADIAGWQIITFSPATKYRPLVGVARVSKEKTSGDRFTSVKIGNNRLLVAVSDGIGSGEHAHTISTATINLIEKFYRAGFSSEHIVDNVNKVVSYRSGENFCAVDICVLGLDDGRADFIKRGGTPSVIKKQLNSMAIEGDSLPIGVIENSKSKMVHYYLNAGEIVVLASDGVFDAFGSSDNFAGYINNLPAENVQELANSVLKKALKLYHGEVRDDMTVVAVKIILNN